MSGSRQHRLALTPSALLLGCTMLNPAFDDDRGLAEGSGSDSGVVASESGDGDPGGDGEPSGDGEPGGDGDGDPCPPDQTPCNDQCVEVDVDPKNCGECGNPCGDLQQCFEGACVSLDRVVFRSNGAFPGMLGGLGGADQACTDEAKEASLPGEYMA